MEQQEALGVKQALEAQQEANQILTVAREGAEFAEDAIALSPARFDSDDRALANSIGDRNQPL